MSGNLRVSTEKYNGKSRTLFLTDFEEKIHKLRVEVRIDKAAA